jgi:hypothetical protein
VGFFFFTEYLHSPSALAERILFIAITIGKSLRAGLMPQLNFELLERSSNLNVCKCLSLWRWPSEMHILQDMRRAARYPG